MVDIIFMFLVGIFCLNIAIGLSVLLCICLFSRAGIYAIALAFVAFLWWAGQ